MFVQNIQIKDKVEMGLNTWLSFQKALVFQYSRTDYKATGIQKATTL